MNRPTIAVVTPALNEQTTIGTTLASLKAQSDPAERIIVADGGSTDETIDIAKDGGAEVLISPKVGRGFQIAAALTGVAQEVVLIAHADMIFPPEALRAVRDALTASLDCPGGCLGHTFASPRAIFRWIEWIDDRRARRGTSYGDQAQFFRRAAVECSGGFPALPIMEDLALAMRLRQLGHSVYLNVPVTVSDRRYERCGVIRTALHNWMCRRAFARDGEAACQRIYQAYYSRQTK